tara:strand:- start:586 stop:786 length:201 start_codon:yes stop_codon:yes gene_type:complete
MTLDQALTRCGGWDVDPASGGTVTIDGVKVNVSDPDAGWVIAPHPDGPEPTADQKAAALVICREWL